MKWTQTIKQNLMELKTRADNMEDSELREFCMLEVRLLAQILGLVSTLKIAEET